MIRKITEISISDVIIPPDLIVTTGKKELAFISESLEIKSELFFVIVIPRDGKYVLVDRHDVYLAALQCKARKISALILPNNGDCTVTHFQITLKSILNPIRIIYSMRPYVEEFGLEQTMKKLHLHSDFGVIYQLNIEKKILDGLNRVVCLLCDMGARTTPPKSMFIFISKVEQQKQLALVKSLEELAKTSSRNFRWPHNVYLRTLEMGDELPKKTPKQKLPVKEIDFCCKKCDTKYVVSDGAVQEIDESAPKGLEVRHESESSPRIMIPNDMVEHLGVSVKNPPKIISSKNVTVNDLASYIQDKKFVLILGESGQ